MAATYHVPSCFPSNLVMQKVFLTAEWRKLIMANYAIDPGILAPHLPAGTELDLREGTCYVSLVGFMFLNTKVKGIRFPFHTNFEEVNLRFYVRFKENEEWKRGTVFHSEIVPKWMIALTANLVYKEHYAVSSMHHLHEVKNDEQLIRYAWDKRGKNYIEVVAGSQSIEMEPGSEAEFIAEHYYGLTRISALQTNVYEVKHPRWQMYPVHRYEVEVDFGKYYGPTFEFLSREKPVSVYLMEGSPVEVMKGRQFFL